MFKKIASLWTVNNCTTVIGFFLVHTLAKLSVLYKQPPAADWMDILLAYAIWRVSACIVCSQVLLQVTLPFINTQLLMELHALCEQLEILDVFQCICSGFSLRNAPCAVSELRHGDQDHVVVVFGLLDYSLGRKYKFVTPVAKSTHRGNLNLTPLLFI